MSDVTEMVSVIQTFNDTHRSKIFIPTDKQKYIISMIIQIYAQVCKMTKNTDTKNADNIYYITQNAVLAAVIVQLADMNELDEVQSLLRKLCCPYANQDMPDECAVYISYMYTRRSGVGFIELPDATVKSISSLLNTTIDKFLTIPDTTQGEENDGETGTTETSV